MDSFEINKIIASILLVALLIIGISKISNIIFKVNKLDSSAYKVELPDDGAKQISEENTMKADDKVVNFFQHLLDRDHEMKDQYLQQQYNSSEENENLLILIEFLLKFEFHY